MNFELTIQQRVLQESMESLATTLNSIQGLSFHDAWKSICKSGIVGITLSEEHGGSGLGAFDFVIAMEGLARGCSNNGLLFSVAAHTLACVIPIAKYGSEKQISTLLPGLCNGNFICANAMTESESGSNVYQMKSHAQLDSTQLYHIKASKTFITNATHATHALLYVNTDSSKGFFGGISAFILTKDQFNHVNEQAKMGLESASLGEIYIDIDSVHPDQMLGKTGGGGFIFNESMIWERIAMASIHLGAMYRVFHKLVDFLKHRKSGTSTLLKLPTVAHQLAELHLLIDTCRSFTYSAARGLDNGASIGLQASEVKLYVSKSVIEFMIKAQQLMGAYGYVKEMGMEQEVRDALAAATYSGTNDIQKNIIISELGL